MCPWAGRGRRPLKAESCYLLRTPPRSSLVGRPPNSLRHNDAQHGPTTFFTPRHLLRRRLLEESHRISDLDAASHFGRQILYERRVVPIKHVREVVGGECQDMRRMLARPDVRGAHVRHHIAVRLGLSAVDVVLLRREHQLRAHGESAVRNIEAQRAPQRRNARKRLVRSRQLRVDVPQTERGPGLPRKPEAAPRVETYEAAVALQEVEYRQVVQDLIGAVPEDEVVDFVYEEIRVAANAAAPVPEAQVEAERGLGVEVRVADVKGETADVRAEVVQLLERGRAVRLGQVCNERAAAAQVGVQSD